MQILNQSSNSFTNITLGVSEGKVGALSKIKSERAELLKFFVDNLKNKQDKKFPAKVIAIKLSHLSLQDIRYMISVAKDIQNRRGDVAMNKWFWWTLKSNSPMK